MMQSFLDIKKMTIIDLIIMDFDSIKRSALKVLEDKEKDDGEEFLALARKCIHAKEVAIVETLKKYTLMTPSFVEDEKEERLLTDEIDRLSFYLKEGRLNRREQKKSLDGLASKIMVYLDKNENLLKGLSGLLTKDMLDEMGTLFLDKRDFTGTDFFPEESVNWKDDTQKLSSRFLVLNKTLWH